jgi:hypothetical protein
MIGKVYKTKRVFTICHSNFHWIQNQQALKSKCLIRILLFAMHCILFLCPEFLSAKNPGKIVSTSSSKVLPVDSAVYRFPPIQQGTQKFMIGGFIGYAYRTGTISGSVPSDLRNYLEGLLGGLGAGANFTYFTSDKYGVGLRYSRFHSSNSLSDYTTTYPVQSQFGTSLVTLTGYLADKISIDYYSAVFEERFVQRNHKGFFILGMNLGYMSYLDEGEFIVPVKIEGGTFGLGLLVGYHYFLNSDISCGANFSYDTGALRSYDQVVGGVSHHITLDQNNYENLNFLNIGISLNYHF